MQHPLQPRPGPPAAGERTGRERAFPAAILLCGFLSPQILATHAALIRLNRSVLYLVSLDPSNRSRARVEARAAFVTLKGLLTRRLTNWDGINAGLTGQERRVGRVLGPDARKGVLEFALEGKFGKAIKIATDQRSRIGGIIPREVFDGANMYSAALDNDGGAPSDLAKLRVPTAFLKAARFSEVDKVVKQNLVYTAYKAHAVAVARAAGIRWRDRAARRAFVRDFMANIARDHPRLHEEALALAGLFGFEYANTPDIVSASPATPPPAP